MPVNSINELKAITGSTANNFYNVLGYYNPGDGGGGDFYWDATSTENDNGGAIIQPNTSSSTPPPGRWKLLHNGEIYINQFGASPTASDSSIYIQKAIDYATSYKNCIVKSAPGTYICKESLTIDLSLISIDFEDTLLDFSALPVSSNAVNFVASVYPPYTQANRYCQGLLIVGDSAKAIGDMTNTGFNISIGSGAGHIAHLTFRNCEVKNFNNGIVFGDNSYILSFDNVDIVACNTCIYTSSTVNNGGELINFRNCTLYSSQLALDLNNPNSDYYFVNCSFDFNVSQFNISQTRVHLSCCHIEADVYIGAMASINNNGGLLGIVESEILVHSVDGSNISGRLASVGNGSFFIFENNFLFNYQTPDNILCDGTGQIIIANNKSFGYSQNDYLTSQNNNLLADGGFEQNSIIDNIFITQDTQLITNRTTGTNIALSVSSAQYHSGNQSLFVNKIGGQNTNAQFTILVPIKYYIGGLLMYHMATSNIVGGINWFRVTTNYCLFVNGDITLRSATNAQIYNPSASWSKIYIPFGDPVVYKPTWATHIAIDIDMAGISGSSASASGIYFDDILITEM